MEPEAEIRAYAHYLMLTDPDMWASCQSDAPNPQLAFQVAAEYGYFYQTGRLAPWTCVLEKVIFVDDSRIFVWRDLRADD